MSKTSKLLKVKKQIGACCVWDFTIPQEHYTLTQLRLDLKNISKKYAFQLEKGEKTEFLHWQGRFSLKVRARLAGVIKLLTSKGHYSITSKANSDNMFYVMKEDTRVDGPYTDENDIYIPRQIREIKQLYPWQQSIIELSKLWDTRHINCIIDAVGNTGKTIITTYMGVHKMANMIPFANDFKDILRMVMDMPTSKNYIIDFPRAIKKDKLYQLYSAIEYIKNGYAYDDRYSFKCKYFDSPNIFVFMNEPPDESLLSRDRWVKWEIVDNELIPYRIYPRV